MKIAVKSKKENASAKKAVPILRFADERVKITP